jgi:nucleotide-binding universal stress UspA family protein
MAGNYGDSEAIDAAAGEAALATATEGAQRATAAGLVAQPRAASHHGGVASGILVEAAAVEADAIVMGTRGLGGLKSFLLGSVSHGVVQHADRAVLVVPSPVIAEHRREWVGTAAVPAADGASS